MADLYDFLSGQVPGGIFLLVFLLLIVHLLFIYLRKSELISRKTSRRNRLYFTLLLLFVYVLLWFDLQPPKPQQRIVVLPTLSADGSLPKEGSVFAFAETLQRMAWQDSLKDRYFLHRWEWLLETVGKDSFAVVPFWRHVAENIGASYLITSQRTANGFTAGVNDLSKPDERGKKYHIARDDDFSALIDQIQQDFHFFTKDQIPVVKIDEKYLEAKFYFYLKDYDRVLKILNPLNTPEATVLKAAVYVQKGLRRKVDRKKAEYLKIKIPEFEQARRLLAPLLRQRKDVKGLAYWLGRMAMHEGDFTRAEIYLKKALVDDPEDCRVHYALSFLLPVRLKELGYGSRIDILEKAVRLDPGYRDAVYDLANSYYLSGSGSETGPTTNRAIKTIERYLSINRKDTQINSLLGMLYIRIKRFNQAQHIFEQLLKQYPNDSNSYYNMGIVYFMKKEYRKALPYFLKAIEIDQNLDSYLYAGITYRLLGNNKMALKYYRERVRRKTGDDDYYALQAMKGIQIILADSLKKTKQQETNTRVK